ncbi:MAG: electron transfer flavoprotein-ubiquinone oxidoreductase [Gammaproteobacteria bacterium]
MERDSMNYDVVIVGAGPAGLAAAIRLRQLALEHATELTVCVLEKGSEIGAHIVSGAVFEPRALNELLPDWAERGAPVTTAVTRDEFYFYRDNEKATRVPSFFVPKPLHNDGNYIISLGNLCRWLGEQAEALDVDIFPGFAAADIMFDDTGAVSGVITGDMGIGADGEHKDSYAPGMELHAKYTVFSEGCRGHLGKQLIDKFGLADDVSPQHYGIGIKELWKVPDELFEPGLVVHGAGWPLDDGGASGGVFLYHLNDNQISVGMITDLNYRNPWLNPYLEFQRFKHHASVRHWFEGGERIAYGARAITKGGLNSLPKMTMPGALLIGCDAGTLNVAKIKGSHTAMKSGMLAAESLHEKLSGDAAAAQDLVDYAERFKSSWLHDELHSTRRFGPALHRFGPLLGGAYNYVDQNWFGGRLPFDLRDEKPDHTQLQPAASSPQIDYPKPDGKISFDRLSSVFLSSTNHEEDQPVHLTLKNAILPIDTNLAQFESPEQRYCPAGVYEIVGREEGNPQLQINAQNCVHCKTCDIKDPQQNIVWVTPEGGGGPNYPGI